MFSRLFKKKHPEKLFEASGVTILLLQRRLKRFSTEELNLAMQRGWRRRHHPVTFFATSLDDGAIFKMEGGFFTMLHVNRIVGSDELGSFELPPSASHGAYSSLMYKCPGGISGELRHQFFGLLALLLAELVDKDSVGLFFVEEPAYIPISHTLLQEMRSGQNLDPIALCKKLAQSS